MKLLTRIAGPLCILVDAAILVDIVMDIHHKIKVKRRAKMMAARNEDAADNPEPENETASPVVEPATETA